VAVFSIQVQKTQALDKKKKKKKNNNTNIQYNNKDLAGPSQMLV
jgi:hypothetical protein